MLDNKSRPMIEKISKLLVSNHFSTFLDVVASPKSPSMHSPRGPKSYDLDLGGVGLGIVAALDKSGEIYGSEILAKYVVSSPRPIPNRCVKKCGAEKEFFRKNSSEHGRNASIFCVSPPKNFQDYTRRIDFLSTCGLCKKMLQGKDIYIYRGEKGFCSNECRVRYIMIDEADDRGEEWPSKATRSMDVSSSPYAQRNILSVCILAI